MTDEQYIDIAIEISKNAKYPYGAIVVKNNEIIGRSDDNDVIETSICSHAELKAIESALKNKKAIGNLKDSTMYVSCEPCMMCMGSILHNKFNKLVYAATLEDSDNYHRSEIITNIDELSRYSKNKIQIVKELHRQKACEILKNSIPNRNILVIGILNPKLKKIYQHLNVVLSSDTSIKKIYSIYSPMAITKFDGNDIEKCEYINKILKNSIMAIIEITDFEIYNTIEFKQTIKSNIPILIIAQKEAKISKLIKENSNIKKIIYYDNIDSIQKDIMNQLKDELEN